MKVDIYIHGVPNGQRIWSTGEDDQVINQFYGVDGVVRTKFLVEVRKSGGQNFCYYSILKYKNVVAENGRAGSYFGLTIRMDMVCTKVKTMFQILDMIYSNAILGIILKKEGDRLQYMVPDFKEKDNHCRSIMGKLKTMLDQSVESNDFVNILPPMLNGRGTPKVNIAEYSSENAFVCISQNGGIAVSAEYPSTQLDSYMRKKDAEVSSIKQQASQNLLEQERNCKTTIQQIRDQANREVAQIKSQYSDVDTKINGYEQQIKLLKTNNETYQRNVVQLQKDVQERDMTIAKLRNGGYELPKQSFMEKFATQVLPFVNLLIGVAVLAVMLFMMPSDNSKQVEQISNEVSEIKETLFFEVDRLCINSIGNQPKEALLINTPDTIVALDQNGDTIIGGEWKGNSRFVEVKEIEDGKAIIKALKKGDVTITYMKNGKSKSRTLKVEGQP